METAEVTKPAMNGAPSIKGLLEKEGIKKRFEEILGAKAPGFISSILNVVNSNSNLAIADPNSVIMSAAVAATLDLPINSNLGFAHIVPYAQSYQNPNTGQWEKKQVAQFQMGWKGYIQLAMRTGQYKTINATPIHAGQLVSSNPLTGEYEFDFSKTGGEVVGYAAYFKLVNGFEKTIYWNVGKVNDHAKKYSKSYSSKTGQWQQNFEAMALKTVVKNLLSQYGILSIEMQKAVQVDMAVIKDDRAEHFEYVDGTDVTNQEKIEASQPENSEQTGSSNIPTSNEL